MGDFFSRLALRSTGRAAVLRPRQPSLFEPVAAPEAAAADGGFGLPAALPSARRPAANAPPGMAVQRHAAIPRAPAAGAVSLTTAGAIPAAGMAAVAATADVPPSEGTGGLILAGDDQAPAPVVTVPASVVTASTSIATPPTSPVAAASASGHDPPPVGSERAAPSGGDPTPTLLTPTCLTGTAAPSAARDDYAVLPPQARREPVRGRGPASPDPPEPAAITVRIGSIELRTPPALAPPVRAGSRLISLDDYLRGSTGRRR